MTSAFTHKESRKLCCLAFFFTIHIAFNALVMSALLIAVIQSAANSNQRLNVVHRLTSYTYSDNVVSGR